MTSPLKFIFPSSMKEPKRLPGTAPDFLYGLSFCTSHTLQLSTGSITIQEIPATDFYIFQWNFKLKENLACFLRAEEGSIILLQTIQVQDAALTVNGQTIFIFPKMYSFLYIPAGTHSFMIKSPAAFFIFIQPPLSFLHGISAGLPGVKELIQSFLQQKKQVRQQPSQPMLTDGWMRLKKLDTSSLQKTIFDLHLRRYIIDVLQDFAKTAKEQPSSHLVYASAKQKVLLLKEYIDKNLLDPALPSLTEMAKQFYIDRRAVAKIFQQLTGSTIPQYIKIERLQNAHGLVIDTTLPIMEISFRCGFNDVSHFIRSYKRKYGATPGQMRLQK